MKKDLNRIKDFYTTLYPEDELGLEINPDITFKDMYKALLDRKEIYDVIGVPDTIIRERLFTVLAGLFAKGNYIKIDDLWMLSAKKI